MQKIMPRWLNNVLVITFLVNLYDPQIGRLNQPVDLERFLETMGMDTCS